MSLDAMPRETRPHIWLRSTISHEAIIERTLWASRGRLTREPTNGPATPRAAAREQFVEVDIAVMSEPNLPGLVEIRELRQENERLKQLVAKLNLMLKA